MTNAEINKALPCGKLGRYTRRGDGVIRTQLWNIRERLSDDFMIKGQGTELTAKGRAMVRDVLDGLGGFLVEKDSALEAHIEHLRVRRIKERKRDEAA